MSLERTIRDTVIAESHDLDGRLQQLVRAGLMPANTIPILRKAIVKVQGGMTLQGAERDVMANFINSMMFIVLGDDAIFNRARAGAKTYATEAKEKTEYDYEGDMAMGQLKSIIANSQRMHDMLSDDTNLPEWVQSKITLAEDYISTASNYMQGEMNEEKMPFEGPYRKVGERKDKYGNPVKNVAKHLAKKAMNAQKNEEVEQIDEILPLVAGAAARYVAGKAGAGVVGRTVAGAATKYAVSKSMNKEEVEQVDEISSDMAHRYLKGKHERDYDTSADGKSSKTKKPQSFSKMNKDMISTARALKRIEKAKKANEEVEQVDEISKATMGRYIRRAKDSIDITAYRQGAKGSTTGPLEKKLSKRHKGIETAVKKLTKEDIDAVKKMNESYKTAFESALNEYGIKSPSELDESKRKEFFNHVDLEFKKGDN